MFCNIALHRRSSKNALMKFFGHSTTRQILELSCSTVHTCVYVGYEVFFILLPAFRYIANKSLTFINEFVIFSFH